jgi:hypothetical protein
MNSKSFTLTTLTIRQPTAQLWHSHEEETYHPLYSHHHPPTCDGTLLILFDHYHSNVQRTRSCLRRRWLRSMIISLSTLSAISTTITTKAAYSAATIVDVYYSRVLQLHPYYYIHQPMALPLLLLHLSRSSGSSTPRHCHYSSISIYDGFSRPLGLNFCRQQYSHCVSVDNNHVVNHSNPNTYLHIQQ